MKRAGLRAIGIGALLTVGLIAMEVRAGENEQGCTLATLKGQYLFSGIGHAVVPPSVWG